MSEIRKPWSTQEDQAVRLIVKSLGTRKWSAVSQAMVDEYGLKGRTGKQCRERWHNHLDPEINRKPWTSKQEKIIFQAHKKYGNKWTDIAQLLDSRTDNAVKNHFYSTIRRSLRRISKTLGQKNSTSQMRDVKPSVLSEIFHYAELPESQQNIENQKIVNSCKSLSESILQFASLKSCVRDQPLNQADRQKLQLLYDNLMKFKEQSLGKKTQNYQSQIEISQSVTPLSESVTAKKNVETIKFVNRLKTQKRKRNECSELSRDFNSAYKIEQQHNKKQSVYDWDQFEKNCQIVQSFVMLQSANILPFSAYSNQSSPNINSFFYPLKIYPNENISKSNKQTY